VVVFGLILLVAILISVIEFRKKKIYTWINRLIFIVSSVAGLFLLFMWLGTDHIATAQNMNVLWLLPAQLLFLISMKFKSALQPKLNRIALIYQLGVSFLLLVWPQEAELSFTLIALVFVVRIAGYIIISNKILRIKG
jgi:hypothetical protein